MLHQKWHLSAWHDCQYEEHLRRLLTSMISQQIYILFLDSCCSCARLGAVVYRCSQVYDTTRMPATDGIFSRSFWLSATLTVFTPAARPVSRTFTMGPMILTSSSSPPPVPARYGLISSSTWYRRKHVSGVQFLSQHIFPQNTDDPWNSKEKKDVMLWTKRMEIYISNAIFSKKSYN